jgi:hypothetical protein
LPDELASPDRDIALKVRIHTHGGAQEFRIPVATETGVGTTLTHTADDGTEFPFRAEVRPIATEPPEGE